jgi:GNAT superfamily N-acetyltransferase
VPRPALRVKVAKATEARWKDLEKLFGPNGACAGCWCMWFRQGSQEFRERHGDRNRRALKRLVAGAVAPGVIAYREGAPVGWCAVAPREQYPRVLRSRTLAPVDERPAWAVTCFYITPALRRGGLGRPLLEAAVRHARSHGARLIEGYPIDPVTRKITNNEAFHGLVSTFRARGFREVERRSPNRPIMRLELRAGTRRAAGARRASGTGPASGARRG